MNEVAAYVAEVRAALADLPAEVREELLEDLPEHLAEVAAEGDEPLRSRLGEPAQYAAELRATVAPGQSGARPPAGLRWAAAVEGVRGRLRTADVRLGPLLGYAKASDYLRLLRPAWWLLRGYLALMAVDLAVDFDGPTGLLPRVRGSVPAGLVVLVGFLVGSVWLGRRHDRLRPWGRYTVGVVSVYLAVLAVIGAAEVDDDATGGGTYYPAVDSSPYGNVQDVFPYDANGRLLRDVRLFDQDGNPVYLGVEDCEPFGSNLYPRCPDQAPFTVPGTSPTPTPTPSPTPTPTQTGTPSPSATR
jgi:hypothetical protein